MFAAMGRRWRMLWAKRRLADSASEGLRDSFVHDEVLFAQLHGTVEQNGPALAPFAEWAEVYPEYTCGASPNYAAFLPVLAGQYQHPVRTVLELGCRAGRLTAALADQLEQVVGLEDAEPLLRQARRTCADRENVRLLLRDYLRAHAGGPLPQGIGLAETFDAIVAPAAALNHVRGPADLPAIFHDVAEHLAPGGFFLADVLGGAGLTLLSGRYLHYEAAGRVWVVVHDYDRQQREERMLAIFPAGIETHRRVPLEGDDVLPAAQSAGLMLADQFADDCYGLLRRQLDRRFYVFRKAP